ncbi:rhomboid family intramembrane serine protease GlpG [Alteromonas facilis]|uniref:rhomboid family intramembrane serine protease GlpG n=1 Tax=Alteromonas facilis TaxID=2048004 RepID=UPI000C293ED7|nr:rhomboid family intramembrane serine protease GlpG [Alteromonas facilis]
MMQPLIAFEYEQAARLLVAHLNAQGVKATYQYTNAAHNVFLLHSEDQTRAVELTRLFLQNPHAKEYQSSAWELGEQASQNGTASLSFPVLKTWLAAPFTTIVSILCIAVFILSSFGGFAWVQQWLFILPLPTLVETGQYWRLLTPDFIHFSAMHIIFNVLWWQMLGSKIEQKLGLSSLLIVFVLASLAANIGQLLMSGPSFGGLSGVVYAVLGFVWWIGWLKPQWGMQLPKSIIGFMLVWLLIGYADVLWVSIANTAHTLGLVSGCLLAWIWASMSPKPR